jgi:DNA-binding MarR family transcriptional regulator
MAEADDRDLQEATDAALLASRALMGVVAASLEPVLDQVTLAQFRALVLLHSLGPMRSGALAERLGIHPSTFTRNGDRLVASGLVQRVGNPSSRREVLIELTPAGRRLVTSVMRRRATMLRRILAPLRPAERRMVVDGLTVLATAADEPRLDDLAGLLGA